MEFLIIIIQSNCIGMDWSRKLQSSRLWYCDVAHYFSVLLRPSAITYVVHGAPDYVTTPSRVSCDVHTVAVVTFPLAWC